MLQRWGKELQGEWAAASNGNGCQAKSRKAEAVVLRDSIQGGLAWESVAGSLLPPLTWSVHTRPSSHSSSQAMVVMPGSHTASPSCKQKHSTCAVGKTEPPALTAAVSMRWGNALPNRLFCFHPH